MIQLTDLSPESQEALKDQYIGATFFQDRRYGLRGSQG